MSWTGVVHREFNPEWPSIIRRFGLVGTISLSKPLGKDGISLVSTINEGAVLALAISVLWALTSLLAAGPARALGGIRFNRLRLSMVALGLIALAVWIMIQNGGLRIDIFSFGVLSLSGLIGIFLGDTLLYSTLARVGPRRTTILFSTHAPMTALLGLLIGDSMLIEDWLGISLVFFGVVIAIVYGKRRDQLHVWEAVRGPLSLGVLLGLGAALSQAVGTIIAAPVLDPGSLQGTVIEGLGEVFSGAQSLSAVDLDSSERPDPVVASAIRVSVSAIALWVVLLVPGPWSPALVDPAATAKITPRLLGIITLNGVLGIGLGMTLFLIALTMTDAAVVATLSSMTPVALLPLIWMVTRQRPALLAWVGAGLAGLGTALLLYQ